MGWCLHPRGTPGWEGQPLFLLHFGCGSKPLHPYAVSQVMDPQVGSNDLDDGVPPWLRKPSLKPHVRTFACVGFTPVIHVIIPQHVTTSHHDRHVQTYLRHIFIWIKLEGGATVTHDLSSRWLLKGWEPHPHPGTWKLAWPGVSSATSGFKSSSELQSWGPLPVFYGWTLHPLGSRRSMHQAAGKLT